MLQRKPSMPTISTVLCQSPSFPTLSHLPVTVTGAFASAVVALAGALVFELLVAGLFVAGGLLAGAFEELTVTLPEQAKVAAANPSARISIGALIEISPCTQRSPVAGSLPRQERGKLWFASHRLGGRTGECSVNEFQNRTARICKSSTGLSTGICAEAGPPFFVGVIDDSWLQLIRLAQSQ